MLYEPQSDFKRERVVYRPDMSPHSRKLGRTHRADFARLRRGMAHPVRGGRSGRIDALGWIAACLALVSLLSCAGTNSHRKELVVTATAYNSLPDQTEGDPEIGAWGDRLDPAVPSIAVSRDLEKMGLTRGARLRIEGFEREFIVLDRMNRRWERRIDIYMGVDRQAALNWGKREVRITFLPQP